MIRAFLVALLAVVGAVSADGAALTAQATMKHLMIARGDVRIDVLAQGSGPDIVILPSLGRGAEDYDFVTELLAADGFRVLRPQPRGIGASTGPMGNLSLHDLAADVAMVIEHESKGPVVVVGHAFGNWVGRTWCAV